MKGVAGVDKEEKAYVVMTNTDCTEGRGRQYPIAVCKSKTTALRAGSRKYVMGTDCPIEEVNIFYYKGYWYGPINLIEPTKEDEAADQKALERAQVLEKAKKAGLTDKDLAVLKNL